MPLNSCGPSVWCSLHTSIPPCDTKIAIQKHEGRMVMKVMNIIRFFFDNCTNIKKFVNLTPEQDLTRISMTEVPGCGFPRIRSAGPVANFKMSHEHFSPST